MAHTYYSASPTLAKFHADNSVVRGVMGPVGSGKSVGCCMEAIARSRAQAPYNGVRRTRGAIIRNTFPELKSTTIKTWTAWIPEHVCPIVYGSPIVGRLAEHLGDGTRMEMEVLFLPLDNERDIKKVLSLDLTWAWINEAREIPSTVVTALIRRLGRFPPLDQGGPSWSGIWMDTNPPDEDHWWPLAAGYTDPPDDWDEERKRQMCNPQGWRFFKQPGGLIRTQDGKYVPNPAAENIKHLAGGYDYYYKQLAGSTTDATNVYVLGNCGTVTSGRPVYPEYNDETHAADKIEAYKGLPLQLAWDFGLTPAVVIGQVSPRGQLRVMHEFTTESMGLRQFVTSVVRPFLSLKYPGHSIRSFGDPAGAQRSQADEKTCFDELKELGIPTLPAPGDNNIIQRTECVKAWLNRLSDGKPAFQIAKDCRVLRKALKGAYCIERVRVTGKDDVWRDTPTKNKFSHISNALEYLALGVDPLMSRRHNSGPTYRKQEVSAKGWS